MAHNDAGSPADKNCHNPEPIDGARRQSLIAGGSALIGLASLGCLSSCGGGASSSAGPTPIPPPPPPPTVVSRAELESYLSRSIDMHGWAELNPYQTGDSHTQHLDNLRMIGNLGAKHVAFVADLWWDLKVSYDVESYLAAVAQVTADIHAADPSVIVACGCFETTGPGANQVPIPAWVFTEFGAPVVTRNFDWQQMTYADQRVSDGNPNTPAIDITRLESRMWYYYFARRYIDCGMEDIHLGEVYTVTQNDIPSYANYWDLSKRIRRYGAANGRRGFILINALTYLCNSAGVFDDVNGMHGVVDANGNLLLDYYYDGTRAKENPGSPRDCILANYADTIFGRSRGGTSPQGWSCDHAPYVVQLDPGVSPKPGTPIGFPYQWGWSETDWYKNQTQVYRADWLRYAIAWLAQTDPNGYFRPMGTGDGGIPGIDWYHANMPWYGAADDPNLPDQWTQPRDQWFKGFNDEPSIKALWSGAFDAKILNGDFHRPVLNLPTVNWANPDVPSWIFLGQAGVARAGSDYVGSQTLAPGQQLAFLSGPGSMQQSMLFPGSKPYILHLTAALRSVNGALDEQSITVSFDGAAVLQPTLTGSATTYTASLGAPSAGAHRLEVAGLATAAGTALVSLIEIVTGA